MAGLSPLGELDWRARLSIYRVTTLNGYDLAYTLAFGLSAPVWLVSPRLRQKVLKALRERMGKASPHPPGHPAVMIHAVSLGEINATRAMVHSLGQTRPDLHFIISTTTDTGYARGRELYGGNERVTLIRYPLDFTRAIRRILDALKPDVVVLMELEVWPNFVRRCEHRGIPVLLVNGRLTTRSFRNYRLARPLVRRMFARLAFVCAQEQAYAERFAALGVPPQRLKVTGTMKFDTAQIADRMAGADELAAIVGLRPGAEPIWVCGSTGPGEEEIILDQYRRVLGPHPRLRLVLVPRKPERFDEVEELIRSVGMNVIRRSDPASAEDQARLLEFCVPPVILGDTMGELRKFYSIADVVLVGRTLVDLGPRQHGSDMIEPAALAKPTIVGSFTGNFNEVMNQFRACQAMREIASPDELGRSVETLLADPAAAAEMGRRAQQVVRSQQGATGQHVELILRELDAALQRAGAREGTKEQ